MDGESMTPKHGPLAESTYDGWLDRHFAAASETLTVIELGCGRGADTSFLLQTGHRIISCDVSRDALDELERKHPKASVMQFDMRDDFPLETSSADVVVASLCLHFFTDDETEAILREIRRILRPNGAFLCRMNSERNRIPNIKGETSLGSGMYMTSEGLKRFYDEALIKRTFSGWEIESIQEYSTIKFSREKTLWELVLRSTKK